MKLRFEKWNPEGKQLLWCTAAVLALTLFARFYAGTAQAGVTVSKPESRIMSGTFTAFGTLTPLDVEEYSIPEGLLPERTAEIGTALKMGDAVIRVDADTLQDQITRTTAEVTLLELQIEELRNTKGIPNNAAGRRMKKRNEAEATVQQLELQKLREQLDALTMIAENGAVTAPEGGILEEITEKTFSISNPYGGNLLTFSLEAEDAALLTSRTRITISREEQTADLHGCSRKPGDDLTFTVPLVKSGWEPGTVKISGILWEDVYDACIPLEALRRDRNGYFVFVLNQRENLWAIEQTARKVYVQILKQDDSHASVSGLASDMEVIVTTTKPLTDGSRVRVMP